MEKENIKIEEDPIFPEESPLIIGGILAGYGLIKSLDEENEKIIELLNDEKKQIEEKNKLLENFPGVKLAKLVADYGYKEISFEKIPLRIEKELNVEQEKAKKIAEDLKAKLLDLITLAKITEENTEKKAQVTENLNLDTEDNQPRNLPTKKRDSLKKDSYLEPIE